VVALHNLFPSRGIAPYAATDQQSDNLGFFQNRLREIALNAYQTLQAQERYVSVGQQFHCIIRLAIVSRRNAGRDAD